VIPSEGCPMGVQRQVDVAADVHIVVVFPFLSLPSPFIFS